MPDPTFEFFFDCSSPWTYLAFANVQPMAKELGISIDWKPILIGGVFNAVNQAVYEGREKTPSAKARYTLKDMQDCAEDAGIRITWPPSNFPARSVGAMRATLAAQEQDRLVPYATALFRLYWGEDRDLDAPETLAAAAAEVGLDGKALLERSQAPEVKERLKTNTQELIDRGGFGSPTMFVGGDDMYFGNDRLHLVRKALQRRKQAA
ncbi:2-hydroxychromene-2-carboxylate isomerase [Oceanibacterium hippocampi]|uniref:2-hydroxychromene-2-carboxylate isomerase n=1 Tax=Oceanibacterium hippocampi TaxID=745714 RepID=A0A1Y5T654_9PROT|nr:2-hydroxychromene-2-carboxylate isomerase [Oceanibacterium hippocampi]SLN56734.1 2-hydroxychromene-2-carboxylate isomerase [Oceanibacterium hippocampi]